MKKILLCLLTVLLLVGCSAKEETAVEDSFEESVEDESESTADLNEQEPETTDEVVSQEEPEEEYETVITQENDNLVCITATNLKVRKSPNGEVNTVQGYDGNTKTERAEDKCYLILDEQKEGDYTWVKIGEEKWIAADPEWSIYRSPGNYDNKYSLNERAPYSEFARTDSHMIKNSKAFFDDIYEMTDEDYEIAWFLKTAIPDLACGDPTEKIKIDINSLSDEDKKQMFYIFCTYYFYPTIIPLEKPEFTESAQMFFDNDAVYGGDWRYSSYEYYPLVLKEHVDEFCISYYGKAIDFTTVTGYDGVNQVYYANIATGLGGVAVYPIILDKKTDGNIVTVTVSPISYEDSPYNSVEEIRVHDFNGTLISYDELDEHIQNNPMMFKAEIDISDSSNWKFIRAY